MPVPKQFEFAEAEGLLPINVAARRLGVDKKTLYRLIEKGELRREARGARSFLKVEELVGVFGEAARDALVP